MHTRVLLLDLVDDPDAIAAYERWHAAGAVPAAVVASIRRAGIVDMRIHRLGSRLVMLMTSAPGFDPVAKAAADAADADVVAWEAMMATVQHPAPGATAGEKWAEAPCIFSLADQHPAV